MPVQASRNAQAENNIEISSDDIAKIIHGLKTGKAADKQGICAKQLKMLPPEGIKVIQSIIQESINSSHALAD